MAGFADHFSTNARDYAAFRPRYPAALFEWLAGLCPTRQLAWDCGTGSGQAAVGLASWFERVVATDASGAQVAQAEPARGVEYRVAPAEASGLAAASVDTITVAQALHWFDLPAFYAEVRRVARPGAVLAVWTYGKLASGVAGVDGLLEEFYTDTVGPYWPAERILVESGYAGLEFPFVRVAAPAFTMRADWTLSQLAGYLGTWSATKRYRDARGEDPIPGLLAALEPLWGAPERPRPLVWPLTLRVGRLSP